jgi:hypothetical protein
MKNKLKNLKNSTATIVSAIIVAFATIVAGYFSIQAALAPKRLEIAATQTAEAKQTESAFLSSTLIASTVQTAEAKQTELAFLFPPTSTLPAGNQYVPSNFGVVISRLYRK